MDRRRFLLISLGGTFAAPLVAQSQQAGKVWRIGVLVEHSSVEPWLHGFQDGLRELGYVEGQNVIN